MIELFVCRKCGVVMQCSLRDGDILPLSKEILKERCQIPESPCTEAGSVCDFGLLNRGVSMYATCAELQRKGERVAELEAENAKLKEENSKLRKICGMSMPRSTRSMLHKLCECADILLDQQGYDGYGWELIHLARLQAREHIAALQYAYLAELEEENASQGVSIKDVDTSVGIKEWIQDGDYNLSDTCETLNQVVYAGNRLLDQAYAQEIVGEGCFLGEDGKYYVGVTTYEIIEAKKDYVDTILLEKGKLEPVEEDNGERCECGKPAGHE